jgi:hypothetical protein
MFAALPIAACADTHSVERPSLPSTKLRPGASAFVAVPTDGRYGRTVYNGSGLMTTQIVARALARKLQNVEQATEVQSHEAALLAARRGGAIYLFVPTILQWEDRATEWSGISDKVEIQLRVIDVASGAELDRAIINGRSGLATFGGDHPQDLLPKPVGDYIDALF